jgi:hypothetical protein
MSLQEVSGDKYEGKRIGKRWKVPVTSRNYQRNWPMMSRSTENRGTGRARPNGERKLVGIPTHNFMENWESFLCLSVSQTHCRFRHLRTNRMFFFHRKCSKVYSRPSVFLTFVDWALGPIR